MDTIALIGLLKIELPTGDVRLCDGGFITFASEVYRSAHPTFGALAALENLEEGVGDEVPALKLTLNPDGSAVPADLSQPGFQTSRVRLWMAEYSQTTNAIIGTPDLLFDGQIDQTIITVGRDRRDLDMTVVSTAERLFNRNEGNSLNATWHKSIWSGETGHDEATGLTIPVAWGVESATTTMTRTNSWS